MILAPDGDTLLALHVMVWSNCMEDGEQDNSPVTGVEVAVGTGVGVGWVIVTYSVSSTVLVAEATSLTQALPDEQAFSPMDTAAAVTSRLPDELAELQEAFESSQWELILNFIFVPDGDTLLGMHVMVLFTCIEDGEHDRSPLGVEVATGVDVAVGLLLTVMVVLAISKPPGSVTSVTVPVPALQP